MPHAAANTPYHAMHFESCHDDALIGRAFIFRQFDDTSAFKTSLPGNADDAAMMCYATPIQPPGRPLRLLAAYLLIDATLA